MATAAFAILMTSVVAMALVARRFDARTSLVPVESGILVALYAASTMVLTLG